MKKLSIVIPVYYNEQSLGALFSELLAIEKELEKTEVFLELIFIDDGSGDNSWQELNKIKEHRPMTKLIKLTRNFGEMSALKTGSKFITGDCFVFLAADLQDPPALVLQMVDKWLSGAKYVICARNNREDPWPTKLFAFLYYKIIKFLMAKGYPAKGFNLCLMDKELLPYLQQVGKHINVPLFSYWLGFEPEIIQYKRIKREHGKSRWTFFKKMKFFIDSVFGFSFVPIRIISIIGIVVSFFSFGYGISVVCGALFWGVDVPGFATVATLLSFLLGLIILMLGIIGEFIWRIFDEVNKHPEAVIDELR